MATMATGWQRMWGPHPEVSDGAIRFRTLLWGASAVLWAAVLLLSITLAPPSNPWMLAVYVLALAAAVLNVAVWVHAARLRRTGTATDRLDVAEHA